VEVARFAYDPLGRRVEKVAGGVTTSYTCDAGRILREVRGSTTLKYVHGPAIDEALAEDDGSSLSYLHGDGLGSIMKRANAAGTVTLTREYDAWGNPNAGAGEPGFAFTGREWDPETGLYYYRARYYDPRAGRFVSEDPSRMWSRPNLYGYVENNPVDFTDPLGLMKVKQGVALPTGALVTNLQCLERCLGRDIQLRSTETTGSHPPNNPHTRGEAADFTVGPKDPFVNPRRPLPLPPGITRTDVLCCARNCGFAFSQYETARTPGATAAHFHVQIPTGGGGATRPTAADCCNRQPPGGGSGSGR
jgi:RHS repeat-associated protein